MSHSTATAVGHNVNVKKLLPSLMAGVLGLVILFGVALANSEIVHNAAHDTRHSAAFPCH